MERLPAPLPGCECGASRVSFWQGPTCGSSGLCYLGYPRLATTAAALRGEEAARRSHNGGCCPLSKHAAALIAPARVVTPADVPAVLTPRARHGARVAAHFSLGKVVECTCVYAIHASFNSCSPLSEDEQRQLPREALIMRSRSRPFPLASADSTEGEEDRSERQISASI